MLCSYKNTCFTGTTILTQQQLEDTTRVIQPIIYIHTYIHTYIHVYIYILTCRYTHTARVMESVVVERAAHFAALAARLTNSWVDMKRRKRVVVHMPSISREEAQVPTLLALLVQK